MTLGLSFSEHSIGNTQHQNKARMTLAQVSMLESSRNHRFDVIPDSDVTDSFRAKCILNNKLQQCIANYHDKFFYNNGRKKNGLLRLVAYFRNNCFGSVDYDAAILLLNELPECGSLPEIFSAITRIIQSGNSSQLTVLLYESILNIMNINQWHDAYKIVEAIQLQQWKNQHQSRETRAMKKQLIAAATKKQLCRMLLLSSKPCEMLENLASCNPDTERELAVEKEPSVHRDMVIGQTVTDF